MVYLLADVPMSEPWPEVPVTDLSKIIYAPIIRFPIWTIWLKQFLHQWRPDILHAHRVNSAGWLAAASGFHPLVITPWGSDLYRLSRQTRLASWLARYVLRRADLVTADALDLLKVAANYGANPASLHVIQWGVDLSRFLPGLPDATLCAELGLGGSGNLVPAVNPIYNLDIILQALPGLRLYLEQC
jgi:glycosyltransferase involved in cell wall biosynthesis